MKKGKLIYHIIVALLWLAAFCLAGYFDTIVFMV